MFIANLIKLFVNLLQDFNEFITSLLIILYHTSPVGTILYHMSLIGTILYHKPPVNFVCKHNSISLLSKPSPPQGIPQGREQQHILLPELVGPAGRHSP